MPEDTHPDPEQLDRLRAGLLDDAPETRAALEAHVRDCARCRARLENWGQLGPNALGPRLDEARLTAGLQRAQRAALSGADRRHPGRYASLATAALLLVVVGAGLLALNTGLPERDSATRVADAVPEIYEDIDFYLWLADQQDEPADKHGDPANST